MMARTTLPSLLFLLSLLLISSGYVNALHESVEAVAADEEGFPVLQRRLLAIDRCRLCPTIKCPDGVSVTCATGPAEIPCTCCGARNCITGASGCVSHTPQGSTSCGF